MFMTKEEIREITGKKNKNAQCRILRGQNCPDYEPVRAAKDPQE